METTTPPLPPQVDTLIVGGGLAGLAAARTLAQQRREIHLLEASSSVGGRVATDVISGYQCDRGFQVYLDAYTEGRRFLDHGRLHLRKFSPGARIFTGKRWATVGDPLRMPSLLIPTMLSGLGTPLDNLRVLALRRDLLRPGPAESPAQLESPQQSTMDYLRSCGFSDGFIRRFFVPFYGGILLDRSLRASSHFFRETFRFFAMGSACVPAQGMGAIPAQIAAELTPRCVSVGRPAVGISRRANQWAVQVKDGEEILANHLIIATDRPTAARLLETLPDNGPVPIPERVVDDVGTTCVWFTLPQPVLRSRLIHLNGDPENGPIHNLAEMSTVAPEYVPASEPESALYAATVLDADSTLYTSVELLQEAVLDHLARWFGPRVRQTARILTTQQIPFAQPGQSQLLDGYRLMNPREGLYLAGDYLTLASINGALLSGRLAAELVLERHS